MKLDKAYSPLLFVFTKRKVLLMHTELFVNYLWYDKNVISIRTCVNWFKRFKNSDFDQW